MKVSKKKLIYLILSSLIVFGAFIYYEGSERIANLKTGKVEENINKNKEPEVADDKEEATDVIFDEEKLAEIYGERGSVNLVKTDIQLQSGDRLEGLTKNYAIATGYKNELFGYDLRTKQRTLMVPYEIKKALLTEDEKYVFYTMEYGLQKGDAIYRNAPQSLIGRAYWLVQGFVDDMQYNPKLEHLIYTYFYTRDEQQNDLFRTEIIDLQSNKLIGVIEGTSPAIEVENEIIRVYHPQQKKIVVYSVVDKVNKISEIKVPEPIRYPAKLRTQGENWAIIDQKEDGPNGRIVTNRGTIEYFETKSGKAKLGHVDDVLYDGSRLYYIQDQNLYFYSLNEKKSYFVAEGITVIKKVDGKIYVQDELGSIYEIKK